MQLQPYLFFGGKCEEAIEFYKRALGAKVETVMHYKEAPEPTPPGMIAPGWEDKVMHSEFRIGEAVVMGSDGMGPADTKVQGVSLALSVADVEEADKTFAALAEGGEVQMPIGKTFFSPRFGVVADRFGVSWMVVAPA